MPIILRLQCSRKCWRCEICSMHKRRLQLCCHHRTATHRSTFCSPQLLLTGLLNHWRNAQHLNQRWLNWHHTCNHPLMACTQAHEQVMRRRSLHAADGFKQPPKKILKETKGLSNGLKDRPRRVTAFVGRFHMDTSEDDIKGHMLEAGLTNLYAGDLSQRMVVRSFARQLSWSTLMRLLLQQPVL